MKKTFKRYTITAALPYANGPLHIGHLAGVYVPADLYVRYLRLRQRDVVFVCGSDEHGVAIKLRAKKENKSPKEIVDFYHHLIKKSFDELGISFDIYHRTSDELHHKTASEFFKKLYDKNAFEENISEQYYDPKEKQFLADRYIQGTCPKCAFEEAYGDQCENCGVTLTPNELINPQSMISGETPILKKTKHWYLPLDKHENWLKKWILEENKEWKTNVLGQCKSWLDGGLQPRPMTRDLDWGIKVPIAGAEGKVLYVWFDAPIGYISATKAWSNQKGKNWEDYWKSPDTKLVHFIGKDNIVFHCIVFPVLLKSEGSYILPKNVPANEFLKIEGKKLSTSKNRAIWLHEFLEEMPNKEDVLRYVLIAKSPETKDNDFTWKDFQTLNNSELVGIFGNFINRTVVLTHKYFDGNIPSQMDLQPYDLKTLELAKTFPQKIAHSIEKYRFREAQNYMMDLARLGNKYLADTEPWKIIKINKDRVNDILFISLQIAASLATFSAPFLPKTSNKIMKIFSIEKPDWDLAATFSVLKSGMKIEKPYLLFDKIEDEIIQKNIQKLMKTEETPQNISVENEKKPTLDFQDFTKMDLKVGEILTAEKMEKSHKLLKFTVDLGYEKRTILSGVAKYFAPEDLIGTKVMVLCNLPPRKMMGIASEGMILFAENPDGSLHCVTPSKSAQNGTPIN